MTIGIVTVMALRSVITKRLRTRRIARVTAQHPQRHRLQHPSQHATQRQNPIIPIAFAAPYLFRTGEQRHNGIASALFRAILVQCPSNQRIIKRTPELRVTAVVLRTCITMEAIAALVLTLRARMAVRQTDRRASVQPQRQHPAEVEGRRRRQTAAPARLTNHAVSRGTMVEPQIGLFTQAGADLVLFRCRAIAGASAAPTPARFLSMWMEMASTLRTRIAVFSSTLEQLVIRSRWPGRRPILTTLGWCWIGMATAR